MRRLARVLARKYAAVVDKAALERWKKGLKTLTKVYRDIPVDFAWDDEAGRTKATEYWEEAVRLFRTFRLGFVDWAYNEVLSRSDKGLSTEQAVRKTVWDLKYHLELLFPQLSNRAPDFSELRNDRERNIKRFQGAATKAFKALEEYIEAKGGTLDRRDPVEHLEVGGITVLIENPGRELYDEEDLHRSLNAFRKNLDAIKSAGFGVALKGLKVIVNFEAPDVETAGKYTPSTDRLTLYPLSTVAMDGSGGTLIHELGHRFWFRILPSNARQHWEDVISSRGVKITKDDIQRFFRSVSPRVTTPNLLEGEIYNLSNPQTIEDELKFRELSEVSLAPLGNVAFDPTWYLQWLNHTREGEVVQVEEITDYGDSSPEEGFAEGFRLWVQKGPRALKPFTRELFRSVCQAGGARI